MKRLLCFVIALALLAVALPVSAKYENTYIPTGDLRADIVGTALTQLGYYEGCEQYAGYTKFGAWYAEYTSQSSAFVTAAWCAMFVTWCSYNSGAIGYTGSFAYCPWWVAYYKSVGAWKSRSSGYIPIPGDIIFFQDSGSYSATHVGIVEYVSGNTVHTVEGNTSNCCARRSYALTNTYIMGYGAPDYEGDEFFCEQYTVTASSGLNLRASADASSEKCGYVPKGFVLCVRETKQAGGLTWGKVYHEGYWRWCALDYAEHNKTVYRGGIDEFALADTSKLVLRDGILIGVRTGSKLADIRKELRGGMLICDDAVIHTGSIISILHDGEVSDSIEVAVPGDINRNGRLDAADYLLTKRAYLKLVKLDDAQLAAVNGRGKSIAAADYVKIKRACLGLYDLYDIYY